MNKNLLFLVIFLLSNTVLRAQIDFSHTKTLVTGNNVELIGMVKKDSTSTFFVGNFSGTADFNIAQLSTNGSSDGFLLKCDAYGNPLWVKQIQSDQDVILTDLQEKTLHTPYTLCGNFKGNAQFDGINLSSNGDFDFFWLEFDENGSAVNLNSRGGTGKDWANAIYSSNSNVALIGGYFEGNTQIGVSNLQNNGQKDAFFYSTFGDTAIDFGGTGNDEVSELYGNDGSDVKLAGYFENSFNFDGKTYVSDGGKDVFFGYINNAFVYKSIIIDSNSFSPNNDFPTALSYYHLALNFKNQYTSASDSLFSHSSSDAILLNFDTEKPNQLGGASEVIINSFQDQSDFGSFRFILGGKYKSGFGEIISNTSNDFNGFITIKMQRNDYERLETFPSSVYSDVIAADMSKGSFNISLIDTFVIAGNFTKDIQVGEQQLQTSAKGIYFTRGIITTKERTLDVNNNSAYVSPEGTLFSDFVSVWGLEIPKISTKKTVLTASNWFSGISQGKTLSAYEAYMSSFDFIPGPVSAKAYQSAYESWKWNRVWKVDKSQIDVHQQACGTSINYKIPEVILNWPAHGNPNKGQAHNLAPFVDVNGNGIYDPTLGDYPKIKGDQAIYFMYNDAVGDTNDFGTESMKIEVHGLMYAYSCTDTNVNNALFIDYKVYNRSSRPYTNFSLSHATDGDLGFYNDDFTGCDTNLNTIYYYNADSIDELPSGYGEHPPAQAVTFLNQNLHSFVHYWSDFSGCQGLPISSQVVYNYANGLSRNGTPITTDHNVGGFCHYLQDTTKFYYPGDPVQGINWTCISNYGSSFGDVKTVASVQKSTALMPDSAFEVSLMYSFFRADTGNNLASVLKMQNELPTLIQAYDSGSIEQCLDPLVTYQNPFGNVQKLLAVPNPIKTQATLYFETEKNEQFTLSLYDLAGNKVLEKQFSICCENCNSYILHRPATLNSGMYVIQLLSDKRNLSTKVFLE